MARRLCTVCKARAKPKKVAFVMLGILCGLQAEARFALLQPRARVGISAARPEKAREEVKKLIRKGAKGLLSFGLAGALSPDLAPGAVVVGTAVESKGQTYLCDPAWTDALAKACKADATGFVTGVEVPLVSIEQKESQYVRTGALVADMESQIVAEAAIKAHLPFTVLRIVADGAMLTLPSAARVPLLLDGRVDMRGVLRELALHPWELAALIRLAAATGRAMKSMQKLSAIHWAEV